MILLDEPTRGLDYRAKTHLVGIVTGLAAEVRTVVISTHDVEFVTPRTSLVMVPAAFLGLVAFVWPFLVAPGKFGSNYAPPLIFGVLSAVNAALRPLGAGTAGIETSSSSSSSPDGSTAPASDSPSAARRCSSLRSSPALNLSFWPFSLDPDSSIAYLPGPSFTEQWQRYLAFDVATLLGRDTGRAVTNFVCITLAGPAVLTTFRRAARPARFQAAARFEGPREQARR